MLGNCGCAAKLSLQQTRLMHNRTRFEADVHPRPYRRNTLPQISSMLTKPAQGAIRHIDAACDAQYDAVRPSSTDGSRAVTNRAGAVSNPGDGGAWGNSGKNEAFQMCVTVREDRETSYGFGAAGSV